jgi:hypothetical protein
MYRNVGNKLFIGLALYPKKLITQFVFIDIYMRVSVYIRNMATDWLFLCCKDRAF